MHIFLLLLTYQVPVSVELKLAAPLGLYKTQQPLIQRAAGNIYVAGNTDLFVLTNHGEQIHQNDLKQTLNNNLKPQSDKNWYISNFTVLPGRDLICISLQTGKDYKMVFTDLEAREVKGYGIDSTLPDPTQAGFRQLFALQDGSLIANVSKRGTSYGKHSMILREVGIYPVGDEYQIEYLGEVESRYFETDSRLYADTKVVLNQLPDGRVVFAYRQTPRINFYHRGDEDFFEKKGYVSLALSDDFTPAKAATAGRVASKILAIASDDDGGYRVAYLPNGRQHLRIAQTDSWGKKAFDAEADTYEGKLFVAFDPEEGVWLYQAREGRHFLSLE